jgi:hypothetical protein
VARVNVIIGVTISSADIRSRPRNAGEPSPARPSRLALPRAVRLAAALAGLAAIVAYVYLALSRLGYPFAVEPLEGNSLIEVHRVLAGQPLYPAPTAGYVPDGYPPLYFYLSAAVASVLGVSYLPLRLVSLVSSLACFALLGRLVQRETGSATAGASAAGVFAATYFATGTWFDVGRVDSLFLALSIAGLYAARHMRAARGAVAAGVLLAAAALTKQTGLAEGVAVFAALLTTPRRRLTCVAALTWGAVFGAATLAIWRTDGRWYLFYVFELMREQSLTYRNFGWFWALLVAALGLAACAALIGARRVPRELLAGCAALAVEGYATLVHSGGSVNDVLPAYLAVALLAGLALGSKVRWVTTASGLLILAQTVFLLASWHPARAIPASADRAVGARLAAGMRALGGDVVVPAEPALSLEAGMALTAHPGAVYDVLRARDKPGIESYRRSAAATVAARQYRAIIADGPGQPLFDPPGLTRYYQECLQPQPAGPGALLVPVAGGGVRPAVVWIPRGSGTCRSVISMLNDGKEARS